MTTLSYLLIFSFCFLTIQKAESQEIEFSGQVVTFDSIPVSHATIRIKSSKQKIVTNFLGEFKTVLQSSDKIKVSAEGFATQNLKIDGDKNFIRVNLKLLAGERNMDLAINNGHVSNPESFTKVVQLNNDKNLDFSQYTTVYKLIEGRFPNTEIRNGQIIIRGYKSTRQGASGALIVLDGIITDEGILSSLSPSTIKSINVIPVGSTALYGPGALNGLVEIKTKGFGD
ncbi:TonB-dependent receptor [Draconibacterium sp.]|nr:TonB-dependent receptor [Draconibacterium sp.]